MKSNTLWFERYRPATLDEYMATSDLKSIIHNMIQNDDIPHLLFAGTAGTGKTSLAQVIVRALDSEFLYINASDENNVDTVRTKIKSFASSVGFSTHKIIILDEADFLTPNAQAALRNIMETFSATCRFILTCNYAERIIEALHSRLQTFIIAPPSKRDACILLARILKAENVAFTAPDVKTLIDAYYPDIRKTIGEAQNRSMTGALVIDTVQLEGHNIKAQLLDILNGNGNVPSRINKIRQLFADNDVRDFIGIYQMLYSEVDKYAPNNISQVILHIAEGQKYDTQVVNKEINMMAALINILETIG